MNSLADVCRELTWGQLVAWSNKSAVLEGRKLQQKGAVKKLMRASKGEGLLAWVEVEEPFAVLVEMEYGEFFAKCSCNPIIYPCEHAVAVIIQYIVYLKRNSPVPEAKPNDPRLYLV
ncbi:MAG: SWIM zinc finger family protein [Desulfobacterales bacterium]|nr:SWIM zinc finger family protein [Desulfobacterales bacterium]